jgi:hypothetical protein
MAQRLWQFTPFASTLIAGPGIQGQPHYRAAKVKKGCKQSDPETPHFLFATNLLIPPPSDVKVPTRRDSSDRSERHERTLSRALSRTLSRTLSSCQLIQLYGSRRPLCHRRPLLIIHTVRSFVVPAPGWLRYKSKDRFTMYRLTQSRTVKGTNL